jgi:hypothetical protein
MSSERTIIAERLARVSASIAIEGASKPLAFPATLRWSVAEKAPRPQPLPMRLIALAAFQSIALSNLAQVRHSISSMIHETSMKYLSGHQ